MARVLTAVQRCRNTRLNMSITLWGRTTSANVQKVLWALGELGLSYEHIPLGGRFGGNREPAYLAMNPHGLVPTLKDGDLVLWESHAIVRYLAAQYGAGSLWPESPVARAESDRWTDWTATTFQAAWLGVFWKYYRTAPESRDPAAISAGIAAAEACFEILDARLAAVPWLGGDTLTYADICAGVGMHRWRTMGIAYRRHANVERWAAALHERAAYRDSVETDYAELAGRASA